MSGSCGFEGSATWNSASPEVRSRFRGVSKGCAVFHELCCRSREECRRGERTNGVPAPTGSGTAHLLGRSRAERCGEAGRRGNAAVRAGSGRSERDQRKSRGPSRACVVRICHPNPWEVKTGGPEGQSHPRLGNEFEASLGYLRPCLR